MKTWKKLLLGLGAAIAGIGIYGSVDALSPANVNGCQYLASPPTLSDLQTSVIQCDSSGKLQTTSTFAPSGTQDVNVKNVNGGAVATGSGAANGQTQRVILSSDSPAGASAKATAADPTYVEGSSDPTSMNLTGYTRTILSASSPGIIALGQAAEASSVPVTMASNQGALGTVLYGALGQAVMASSVPMTLASDQSAVPVYITAATTGGASTYTPVIGASDNHAVIKNGAGRVSGVDVANNSATINYVRLYDAGTGFNGCNSATGLKWQFMIPGNSTNGGGFMKTFVSAIQFNTGISICVTSGFGQTDTTNATASAITLSVEYN